MTPKLEEDARRVTSVCNDFSGLVSGSRDEFTSRQRTSTIQGTLKSSGVVCEQEKWKRLKR